MVKITVFVFGFFVSDINLKQSSNNNENNENSTPTSRRK